MTGLPHRQNNRTGLLITDVSEMYRKNVLFIFVFVFVLHVTLQVTKVTKLMCKY